MNSVISKTNRADLKPSEVALLPSGLHSDKIMLTFPEYIRNGTFQCDTNGTNFNITTQSSVHINTGWHLKQNGGSDIDTSIVTNSGADYRPDIKALKRCKVAVNSVSNMNDRYVILEQRVFDVTKFAGQTLSLEFDMYSDTSRRVAVEIIFNEDNGQVTTIKCKSVDVTTKNKTYSMLVAMPSLSGVPLGELHNIKLRLWLVAGESWDSRIGIGVGSSAGQFFISNVRDGSKLTPLGKYDEYKLCDKYFFNSGKVYFNKIATTTDSIFCTADIKAELAYIPKMSNLTMHGLANAANLSYEITKDRVQIVAEATHQTSSARFNNLLINLELPE